MTTRIEIVGFVVSPEHAYEGRPGDGPREVRTETPDAIAIRAGHGVVGDRYAGQAAHREAAVTVLAVEALEAVADELGVPRFDPAAARRTIVTRGLEVEALRGREFAIDSGDGPVLLGGGRPAAPCAWMDVVLAPGAHAALRGRAGVRCAALGSGTLRVGPATVAVGDDVVLDPSRAGVPHRRRPAAASSGPRTSDLPDGAGV
ncbi:MOSC domain-containing protein [Actinomycetospora sp. NBRC 106375]|uniref:MOSC domain-containing protein n=1 Tax=Actinomycetospora sp. NBRC 106375 TaxID=3032207 RepID=UPI00255557A5|nr:MOSC domain-containing protein [Actinomycetospora sp. NBRC 106375]